MSDPQCYYCLSTTGVDHKHGPSQACGDCCGMHGSLVAEYPDAYEWVKECIASYCAELTRLRAEVERLEDLRLRWSRAASDAGICGSEYVDDPERVFATVMMDREFRLKAMHRLLPEKAELRNRLTGTVRGLDVSQHAQAHRIATLTAENKALREALGNLAAKLHLLNDSEELSGVFTLAYVHGHEYRGPNWKDELAAADALLGEKHGK